MQLTMVQMSAKVRQADDRRYMASLMESPTVTLRAPQHSREITSPAGGHTSRTAITTLSVHTGSAATTTR